MEFVLQTDSCNKGRVTKDDLAGGSTRRWMEVVGGVAQDEKGGVDCVINRRPFIIRNSLKHAY